MTKEKRKPSELIAGHAYRMYELSRPSPAMKSCFLTEVDPPKWNRQVKYVPLGGDMSKPQLWWYTPMMQRVHSEAPAAIN
jgi:hypothetical protein